MNVFPKGLPGPRKPGRPLTKSSYASLGPSVIQWAGKPVVQALRWLGPDAAADARVLSTLSRQLPEHVKRDLVHNERNLPGWALPLARSITNGQAVAV